MSGIVIFGFVLSALSASVVVSVLNSGGRPARGTTGRRVLASVTLVLDDRGYVMIQDSHVPAASVMFARVSGTARSDWDIASNLDIDPQAIDVLDTLRRSLPGQNPEKGEQG